jgi:hypothetical protein
VGATRRRRNCSYHKSENLLRASRNTAKFFISDLSGKGKARLRSIKHINPKRSGERQCDSKIPPSMLAVASRSTVKDPDVLVLTSTNLVDWSKVCRLQRPWRFDVSASWQGIAFPSFLPRYTLNFRAPGPASLSGRYELIRRLFHAKPHHRHHHARPGICSGSQ